MFDESSFSNQVNPYNVQGTLQRLTRLPVPDQVAFLDITTLSADRFNPNNAYNTLNAYLKLAVGYGEYRETSPYKFFQLKGRIYEDILGGYERIRLSLFSKGVNIDADGLDPKVSAENLTKYLISDAQVSSEVEALILKLSTLLTN